MSNDIPASDTPPAQPASAYRDSLVAHIRLVGTNLSYVIAGLVRRAVAHDASKWEPVEFDAYERQYPVFSQLRYGDPGYKEAFGPVKEALQHHFANNDHHPEFHSPQTKGAYALEQMNLIQIMEMFCDWRAAAKRVPGDSLKLELQQERFKFSDELLAIFQNTAKAFDDLEAGLEESL